MFERYTERARQVVLLAQEEARGFNHDYIGTEHILLGLISEDGGVASRILASLGVTLDHVRTEVERVRGRGETEISGQIQFTSRAKKVLELALREALSVGSSYIGTEHVLLGLIRENEGAASRVLSDMDLDSERIRNEVMRVIRHGTGAKSEPRSQEFIVIPKGCARRVFGLDAFDAAIRTAAHDAINCADEVRSWEVIGPNGETSYIQTRRSREHEASVDESDGSSG